MHGQQNIKLEQVAHKQPGSVTFSFTADGLETWILHILHLKYFHSQSNNRSQSESNYVLWYDHIAKTKA
jgi:hypothetical protein